MIFSAVAYGFAYTRRGGNLHCRHSHLTAFGRHLRASAAYANISI